MECGAAKERSSVTTSLVKYNAARLALQQAHAVDEVREIKDRAEALRQYALQVGDVEMQNWMTEIKIRAKNRAGQILEETQSEEERAGRGNPNGRTCGHLPTLKELGVNSHEAYEWRCWSRVPAGKLEDAIATAKAGNSILTESSVKRIALPKPPEHRETGDAAAAALSSKWRALADDRSLPLKNAVSIEKRRDLSCAARLAGEWLLKIASFYEEVSR